MGSFLRPEKQGNLPGMSIYFKPETIYEHVDGAAEVWQSRCGNFTSLFHILSDAACLAGLLCKKARTSPVWAAFSKNPVWLTGKPQPVSISSARSAPARCLWVCAEVPAALLLFKHQRAAALLGENTIYRKKILLKSLQSHR